MIIGICGLIGSGKDTAADYLVNVHGFRRESFAGTLKDAAAAVFGWDRTLLEGRTKESREWREQVDAWWAERLNIPTLTPRWVLQYWGTEVFRHNFHDDIWIASLENKLRTSRDDIVISDCRFPNEINSIRSAGGLIVRTTRGPVPDWYEAACEVNYRPGHHEECWVEVRAKAKKKLDSYQVHASETAWIGTDFDHNLDNHGTMDQLFAQIDKIVKNQD